MRARVLSAILLAAVFAGGIVAPAGARAAEEDEGCDAAASCAKEYDRGIRESCFDAASLYYEGDDEAGVDLEHAREYFRKACELGVPDGCTEAGRLYEDAEAGIDHEKAAALFAKGCDAGDPGGCAELGLLERDGRGVPKDLARAAVLLEKGCTDRERTGCGALGALYEKGEGGRKKDPARAVELYRKGCRDGDDAACASATRLEEHTAPPKDEAETGAKDGAKPNPRR